MGVGVGVSVVVGVGVGVVSNRILQADEGLLISKEPENLRLVPTLQRRDKGGQFLGAMAHDDNRSNDNNEGSLVSLHGGRR